MYYIITYDIEEDRTRNYIAKLLEKKGCARIQKSVFWVFSNPKKIRELQYELKKGIDFENEPGNNILFIPLDKDHFQQILLLGNNQEYEKMMEEKPGSEFF